MEGERGGGSDEALGKGELRRGGSWRVGERLVRGARARAPPGAAMALTGAEEWGGGRAASSAAVLPVTVAAGRASLCAPPALPPRLPLRRREGRALGARRLGPGGGVGRVPARLGQGLRPRPAADTLRAAVAGPPLSRKPPDCSDE